MAKVFEVTCPHCNQAFEFEVPKAERRRGQLYGIALEDMTDEQLKREIINANSVLYKAKQRGASEETIAANQARVDAAKAERAKRHPEPVVEEAAEQEVYAEEISVDEETVAEV